MKNKSITDYIMGGILVGLGLFIVWVFYPREEQQETKPEEIVELKKRVENELISWTNDFTPVDLVGLWKGEDDVYIGYDKDKDEYTWRYNDGPNIVIVFTGRKRNGDLMYNHLLGTNKVVSKKGTIEITTDGMKMRVFTEGKDGKVLFESRYNR